MSKSLRYQMPDLIRGIAVFLMVFFHLFYDLDQFGYVKIDFYKEKFWFYLPRLIVTLFLLAVGMSMVLAHAKHFKKKPFFLRLTKIGVGAIVITITTYFMFPKNWVYFGTLHCIFFCTILCLPFIKREQLALIIGSLILGLDFAGLSIPFIKMKHAAMDYIPVFPWVGVSLIGIYLTKIDLHKLQVPQTKLLSPVLSAGRHAFIIYILHQPLMFGILFIIHKLKAS